MHVDQLHQVQLTLLYSQKWSGSIDMLLLTGTLLTGSHGVGMCRLELATGCNCLSLNALYNIRRVITYKPLVWVQ